MEFCKVHKLDPQKVINMYQQRDDMRIKLIESMCLNVESSFLNYKESGSIDKTLERLHLLKPKLSGVYLTSEQWLEEINRPPKYQDLLDGPKTKSFESKVLLNTNSEVELKKKRMLPKKQEKFES